VHVYERKCVADCSNVDVNYGIRGYHRGAAEDSGVPRRNAVPLVGGSRRFETLYCIP